MKPIVFDLFCGLGGWSEAFIANGYRAIGFDIEAHNYGNGVYPGELILRDMRSMNGADLVKEFGVPTCIVGSPPCQAFSYMAMPWSKAKAIQKEYLEGKRDVKELTALFDACFRIQREVIAAVGHHVPMVVENVRGAQRWVGKARWNFGSFYLWGDVPALMPIPGKLCKTPEGSWDTTRENYNADHAWEGSKPGIAHRPGGATNFHRYLNNGAKSEGNKTAGMNWSDRSIKGQDFTRIAGNQAGDGVKQPSESGRRTAPGNGARFTSRDCGAEGVNPFTPSGEPLGKNVLGKKHGSKSNARKQASAEIAKIPPTLADWIAKVFKQR